MANVAADQQLIKLDMAGVAVSSGSACSSGKVGASRVLQAMNIVPELLQSTIRLSWGWASTAADIDALLLAYQQLLPKVGDKAATSASAQTDNRQIPLAI
jgi:cysteine desulfurase